MELQINSGGASASVAIENHSFQQIYIFTIFSIFSLSFSRNKIYFFTLRCGIRFFGRFYLLSFLMHGAHTATEQTHTYTHFSKTFEISIWMRNYNGISKSTLSAFFNFFPVLCWWDWCKCKMQMQLTVSSSFTFALMFGVSFYSTKCDMEKLCLIFILLFSTIPHECVVDIYSIALYIRWIIFYLFMAFELKLFNGLYWLVVTLNALFRLCANEFLYFLFKLKKKILQSSIWPGQIANQLITFSIIFCVLMASNQPKKKCYVSASPTSTLHQLSANHAIDVLNASRSLSMHENEQRAILCGVGTIARGRRLPACDRVLLECKRNVVRWVSWRNLHA